jgi:hypothetical protein
MDQYPPLSQLGGYNPQPIGPYGSTLPNTQAPSPPLQYNLGAADVALDLTPQEKNLYRMHLRNLTGSGGVDHPDGSRSSLYQSVQEHNGQFYNVPTVWNGRIETEPYTDPRTGRTFDVPNQTALDNVARLGWKQFPSYATPEEADARYDAMHKFMDQDTGLFLASRKQTP